VAALRLCLAAGPPAAEARAIQDDIRRIEAALRRSAEPEAEAAVACEVLVPALVADYWLYIDGRLVSSPPHEGHGIALTTVELGSGQGCEFWDAKGLAIKVNGKGQLISVRSDIRDRAYSKQVLHLEPGTHRFDLLLLNAADFPLSVGSQEVELQAEESAEVKLGMPPGHAYGPRLQAIAAMAYGGSWQQRFDQTQTFLKVRIGGLAADPVARALAESLAGLKISRPERPVVWVNLPENTGWPGGSSTPGWSRPAAASQSEYEVGEPGPPRLPRLPPTTGQPGKAAALDRAHNRRIKDLEEIGAILARVKTGGPGAE